MTSLTTMDEKAALLPPSIPTVQFKPFGLFWNIVKSFAGAGTFALPWAFKNAGLWTGLVGVLLVAILSDYTVKTLLKCGIKIMEKKSNLNDQNQHPPSYPEIGKAAIGDGCAIVISIFSGLMCFGVCIAYYTLIADNMTELLKWDRALIIWLCVPACIFLSCLTDLRALAYSSIGGSLALVIALIVVIEHGLEHHLLSPVNVYPIIKWETLPLFLGSAAFLFCSHVIVLPLANSCGNYRRFPRILDYAVVFVTLANIAFAGLSYGYWRDGTCGNVIKNLPKGSIVADIVRVGISLEVLASFPLVSSAGFQSLETAFPKAMRLVIAFPNSPLDAPHPLFSRNIFYYLYRGGVIAVLALLASTIKNFGPLVSLIGSLTIMSTGFVFPQIFYLRLYNNELKWYDTACQLIIILFGLAMTVMGTQQALQAFIHPAADAC